jgi:superfamily I DNA/RNA helicase
MSDFVSQLNSEQTQAIQDERSVVMVEAGPGTGKTLTLIVKIISLLESGVRPDQVAAMTFTHRAAHEIQERLISSLGKQASQLQLGTFHSFALNHLSQINTNQLLTEKRQQRLVKKIAQEHHLGLAAKDLLLLLSKIKNDPKLLKSLSSAIQSWYQEYQQYLQTQQLFDFDDLMLELLKAIEQNSLENFAYLLVDEFQDVSPLQYQLIKTWAPQLKQTFVIGDPHQAIYGFRGATALAFENLEQDFPQLGKHQLKINYRSRPQILETAAQLFPQAQKLEANIEQPGVVRIIETLNPYSEADWVMADIEKKLGGTGLLQASEFHQEKETDLSDFAIIYRIHQLGSVIEDKLKEVGLPYQKVGSQSLYAQPDVSLIINLLRLVLAENDEAHDQIWLDLLENKLLGLSEKNLAKIFQLAEEFDLSLTKAVSRVLGQKIVDPEAEKTVRFVRNTCGILQQTITKEPELLTYLDVIEQRLLKFGLIESADNLKNWPQLRIELLQFNDQGKPLNAFIKYVQDLQITDFYDDTADKISLLSMHAAKGLEFDWVYLLGFEQGLVPLETKKSATKFLALENHQQQEERNLLYVSLTRAKKGLNLLYTRKRWRQKRQVSRFLDEINNEELKIMTDEKLIRVREKQKKNQEKKRQGQLF